MFEIPKTQERRVSSVDVRGSHTGLGARGSPAPWSERTLVPAVQKTALRLCNSAPGRTTGRAPRKPQGVVGAAFSHLGLVVRTESENSSSVFFNSGSDENTRGDVCAPCGLPSPLLAYSPAGL